jgi:hypothetical protein
VGHPAKGQGLGALKARIGRQPAFTRFVAQEFLLYESHLSPSGARYEVRERFALGGQGQTNFRGQVIRF